MGNCFLLWEGTEDKLRSFLNFPITLNPVLKFPMKIEDKSVCFLDLDSAIFNSKTVFNQK